MVDFEKIGQRITEQRKYLRRLSQAMMAEDLGMYQADISNLEKAKKGSGITDLFKLDMIADYLGVPLEKLLFGKGGENMVKYYGEKMELVPSTKKIEKQHQKLLAKLTGQKDEEIRATTYKCGPYSIYVLEEHQQTLGEHSKVVDNRIQNPEFTLVKLHTYIFMGTEVIGAMVACVTTTLQHVFQPNLQQLQKMIQVDVLDVTDVWRTLNPYSALYMFADDKEEEEKYSAQMYQRMDEIRSLGNIIVLYFESAYVREDCRKNGIFRMYLDVMRKMCNDCIMWLNMEPTAGAELTDEYVYFPSYTVSELGQLSMNASIAEKLGFTVDPDTWHRQAEVLDADGNIQTKVIEIRKCAYFLPQSVQNILKDDSNLVAVGRAKQKIRQQNQEDKTAVDMRDGNRDGFTIVEWKETHIGGPRIGTSICCYAAHSLTDDEHYQFGVSQKSVFECGLNHDGQIETYEFLDDAYDSKHYETLLLLNAMLISRTASVPDEK